MTVINAIGQQNNIEAEEWKLLSESMRNITANQYMQTWQYICNDFY